jgi:hypothetical protein
MRVCLYLATIATIGVRDAGVGSSVLRQPNSIADKALHAGPVRGHQARMDQILTPRIYIRRQGREGNVRQTGTFELAGRRTD